MKITLPYGKGMLTVNVPGTAVRVIEPRCLPGLSDEAEAFREALRAPIASRPLRDIIGAGDRVAVVIPDGTRPFPSRRILPWLFAELAHVPAGQFRIIIGTGSHRPSTPAERAELLGPEITERFQVVDHRAQDRQTLKSAGRRGDGGVLYLNRDYVEADRRIVLGFIEPHFMAGFSGGYKAVMPGVADLDSIVYYHGAAVVADPRSTWGVLEGNPTQGLVRALGSLLPVDFCVNVTLNRRRQITGYFCGGTLGAHERGCAFAKASAMVACSSPFPLVVTTNGGYPLDQNLYQTVKGMSAAAQIVMPGGTILAVSECGDGFPDHGNFARLLREHATPQALLAKVMAPGCAIFDQWEAQLLALIQVKARVALCSAIPADAVRQAHLEPVGHLDAYLAEALRRLGADAPVAVLPEGPLTIPYLSA